VAILRSERDAQNLATFGRRVRDLRHLKRLSQKELTRPVSTAPSSAHRARDRCREAWPLADALGVSVAELFV
jgi:hypothetical protein